VKDVLENCEAVFIHLWISRHWLNDIGERESEREEVIVETQKRDDDDEPSSFSPACGFQ
jgi:hypothetical protein